MYKELEEKTSQNGEVSIKISMPVSYIINSDTRQFISPGAWRVVDPSIELAA